ncbi:Core-2/I-Branching enzyme [Necator americanus]|uniref:Core-2/I-Branching enzyme n=1 Tax=Necator americanus TaxID=51031 RepID=W2TMP5_NECAM|nr:Core-2/I-Branching enzyme [Necator americanus]ETN83048.1 Core-2/I-Branching enzyme [Necator americanus]
MRGPNALEIGGDVFCLKLNNSGARKNLELFGISPSDDYLTTIANNRPTISRNNESYSCTRLRRSILPPVPLRRMEFGVAFARIVYRDYDLIVDELRSSYHPQNNFCYSIDRKADETFRSNIRQLARCFSNILITPEEFDVTAGGYNMNKAHYMCMRMLLKEKGWEYVLLLQNHDVIIKSPYEMVEIYSLLGGANDVHVSRCPEELCSPEMKWTPQSGTSSKTLDTTIELAKGAVQVSLSRAAVQWLIDTVNLTTTLEKLNKKTYGYDEIMMASLQVNEELGMPGRFTSDCLLQGKDTRSISRLSTWKNGPNVTCKSGYARKSICIFGIEDFPSILKYPHVMANKMLPEFDYAIIECIHEVIFNRTFLNQDDHPLDKGYYANMPNVRYNRNRKRPISNFKLTCVRSQDEIDDSYTRAKVVV